MSTDRRARRQAELLGIDRLHVFVPAIMSVGVLFWLSSELRDLLHSSGEASRNRRSAIAGHDLARELNGDVEPTPPWERGLRPRPVYLVIGVALVIGAVYVGVGSLANFLRHHGYVSDIAWLLATALIASMVALWYGTVALVTFWRYAAPPPRLTRMLRQSPLTTQPAEGPNGSAPAPWWLGMSVVAMAAAASLLTLVVVASPHVVEGTDRRIADWFDGAGIGWLASATSVLFSTPSALVLAALVGLAATRCRALATAYITATVLGLGLSVALRAQIERPRPPDGPMAGAVDSYPSGHLIQAVLIASLLPIAIGVLTRRRRFALPASLVLGVAAGGAAISRIANDLHWPSDVAGGILIGSTLALGVRWMLAQPRAHAACAAAPSHHGAARQVGMIHLPESTAARIRLAAHLAAAAVALGLAAMTFTVGLPANTEHYVLGASVQRPVQLALAGLVTVGSLVAWRWPAAGALLIAFAATCLGVFASIEYPPRYAIALTAVVLVPAVLLWLGWQHRRGHAAIIGLAVVTTLLLGTTWVGASYVYNSYFGPTHPDSSAPTLAVDRVEWVWAGGLTTDEVTVTARLAAGHSTAVLLAEAANGEPPLRSAPDDADDHRLVRLRLDGLRPETSYTYRVVVDGVADTSRGIGTFTSPADGPMSFKVAFGGCARTGSNGAVFDAIVAEDPFLYVMLGDSHYGNIAEPAKGPFLDAYDKMLAEPGQAALYRSVPTAYVWDDHDYGPNDADASAAGRSAVREAYRQAVPSYPVPPGDQSIYQAFTIGGVRFVMTDSRSESDATSQLGSEQLEWLLEELTTGSRTHELVVWVNGIPWIGKADPRGDAWAGHAAERTRIADTIVAAGIDNLVMVSGDAHMVAIDDGTNSDYSTTGGGGFPVLHAAALDRPGNVKGGPYSEGAYPGGGQYGVMEIEDTPAGMTVTLAGRTWDGRTLVSYEFGLPG